MDLVNISNIYLNEVGQELRIDLLIQIVKYLSKMLKVFGFEIRSDGLGWEASVVNRAFNTVDGEVSVSREEIGMPFVKSLSKFRDIVRETSIAKGDYKILLEACDKLRDEDLLDLGVALDDRSDGQGALIKFLTANEKEELIKQMREKEAQLEAKRLKKEQQQKAAEEKEKIRREKAQVSPIEMFKSGEYTGQFSEWDSEGLPVKTSEGEEVSKSAKKKLVKAQLAQKKLYDEFH